MKLNNDSIKIKYIIGSFRSEPDYPTYEDFEYLINNWYWNEGGHQFIHGYRGIDESSGPIFPDNILKEKLNGDEKVANDLLESLLNEKKVIINKKTKFTTYYEVVI